jgi:OmpA-OmpF porin, OOP family
MIARKATSTTGVIMVAARIGISACLTLTFLASAPAFSDEGVFYGGAGIGRSEASDFCSGVAGRCDDTDTAWRIFVGYQFNPSFSIEAGFVDFGSVNLRGTVPGLEDLGQLNVSVDSNGWFVTALGVWPVNPDFSLHAKLGAANTRAEFSIDEFGEFSDFSETGVDLVAGFGGAYRLTWNLWLRAEWERYNNVGDSNEDFTMISGSLIYLF